MISVVLYGRNDSHGYNLHKRAAISLNCIAHVLNHANDEIIFVDCNTPDDLPTFPEAIHDLLTPQAKRLLRIFRIRPALFERHKRGTHLPVLEALSRNVAVRRANPANRWILSTNTDMVFVPRAPGRSLSDVVADLPDGFYGLPRFEVPEALWESLDRTDPAAIIAAFGAWGQRLHLNEVVHLEPSIRFDAPGDFQLVLREQFCAIGGFNEEMVLGYHVDSNLCRRLYLLNGRIDTLLDDVLAYHCAHNRRGTLAHRVGIVQNDPHRYVFGVDTPYLPEQAATFGLPDAEIEELRLTAAYVRRFERALHNVLPGMDQPWIESRLVGEWFNQAVFYDTLHAFPYLADHLVTMPSGAVVGYVGCNAELLGLLAAARAALGHHGRLLVARDVFAAAWPDGGPALPPACVPVRLKELAEQADVFVFDLAMLPFPKKVNAAGVVTLVETAGAVAYMAHLRAALAVCTLDERARRRAGLATPRKFLLVGCQDTWFEPLATESLDLVLTAFATHVRHGYLRDDAAPAEALGPPPPSAQEVRTPGRGSERDERGEARAGEASPADLAWGETARPTSASSDEASSRRAATIGNGKGHPKGPKPPTESSRGWGGVDCQAGPFSAEPRSGSPGQDTARERRSARALRLALVAPGPPPRTPAGVEGYAYLLAQELARRGHRVQLICATHDAQQAEGLVGQRQHDGLAVATINVHRVATRNLVFADERLAGVLARHLAGLDADLVHFHDLSAFSAVALRVARDLGRRIVVTAHDAWLLCEQRHFMHAGQSFCAGGPETVEKCADCALARYPAWARSGLDRPGVLDLFAQRRAFFRDALAWIDALVVTSALVRRMLAAHGLAHPRVALLPPGLPPAEARPAGRPDGPLRFTFLGDVDVAMGADLAVRAMCTLGHASASLELYGGVTDFAAFDRLMAEAAAGCRASYGGPLADADLPDILAASDVAVLPARPAGYPALVGYPGLIRRCLQAGVPVIAPNLGVIPEIVADGASGLLVHPGDAGDLAAKLRFFADAPERVVAFRRHIPPQRTLAEDADALEALYDEVLAGAPAQPQAAEPPALALARLGPGEDAEAAALAAFEAARQYVAAEAWDLAARELNRALDLDPLLAAAHYLLGVVETQRGRVDVALGALRRAVELAPGEADFHNALGVALYQAGQAEAAVTALQRALELEAGRADVWANLGELHEALQRWPDAAAAYERALGLAPDDANLRAALERVRAQAGEQMATRLPRAGTGESGSISTNAGLPPGYGAAHAGADAAPGNATAGGAPTEPTGGAPALAVRWTASIFDYSGYSWLSRQVLPCLAARGIAVQAQPLVRDERFLAALRQRPAERALWDGLVQRRVRHGVHVCFHPPVEWNGDDAFAHYRQQNPGFAAYVGMAMFETDRLPRGWAQACNGMDEVWVPSTFNRDSFAQSGVDPARIHVIPFGLDTRVYDPARVEPMPLAGRRGFAFLSVFQWTLRKGWDVLLRAYLAAFAPDDDVCLVLRAYPFVAKTPPLAARIDAYVRQLGHDPARIPPIVLLEDFVPEERMPALYAAADAFVLPTRGEGWGIPFMEAMAMGRPVIATRWSAHLDFMDDATSYLIDVLDLVPVAAACARENPFYTPQQRWAEPSVEHTAALMRRVYEQREEARAIGRRAREHIAQHWTLERTAEAIATRLAALTGRAAHLPAGSVPR